MTIGLGTTFATFKMETIQDRAFKDIVAVIKCSVCASDSFWRTIYAQGIWIPCDVAQHLVVDGWKLCAPRLQVLNFYFLFCHLTLKYDWCPASGISKSMSLCPWGWLLDTGIPVLQSRILWLPGPSKNSYVSPHSASWQSTQSCWLAHVPVVFVTSFVFMVPCKLYLGESS